MKNCLEVQLGDCLKTCERFAQGSSDIRGVFTLDARIEGRFPVRFHAAEQGIPASFFPPQGEFDMLPGPAAPASTFVELQNKVLSSKQDTQRED